MANEIKYKSTFLFLSIWGFFWWYFYSLAPADLVTFGQSAALMRLGVSGGNMNTPILSGLLRLIHLFSNLPPAGYALGYFLSAGLASLGLGLFYVWLSRLDDQRAYASQPLSSGMKLLGVIALSQTLTYKIQAVFVERYLLAGVLMLAVWLMAWELARGKNQALMLLYSLAISLGITMHWIFPVTAVLTTIAWYGRLAGNKSGRISGWPLVWLAGVTALGGWLALSWRFSAPPQYSYMAPANLNEMISAYGKTYLNDGWAQEFTINPALAVATARDLWGGFGKMIGTAGLVFGLLGIIMLFKTKNAFWRWYLVLFGIVLIVPVVGFSALTAKAEIGRLFSLLWMLFWMGFVWLFLATAVDRLYRGLCVLHHRQKVRLGMMIVLGLGLSGWLIMGRNLPLVAIDEEKIMLAIVDQLPDKAVLICFDDNMCGSLLYTMAENNLTDKLTVVPYDYHPDRYVLKAEAFRPFRYQQYPYILHEIVADALHDNVPVYSLGMSNDYWRFLGFELGIVHYIPRGDFGQLALTTPAQWPAQPHLTVDLNKSRFGSRWVSPVLLKLIDARVIGAMVDFKSDRYEIGYDTMNTTAAAAWQLPDSEFEQFLATRAAVENLVHNPLFAKGEEKEAADSLLKAVPFYIDRGWDNRAAELCRGAIMLEPMNRSVRLRVAEYYDQIKLSDLADLERANAKLIVN